MQTLHVIARPGHLVADDRAYRAGARFRFVGRAIAPNASANPTDLEARYPPTPREYPDDGDHRFIRRQIQKGALSALDEYTAGVAGVPFASKTHGDSKARADGARAQKGGDR